VQSAVGKTHSLNKGSRAENTCANAIIRIRYAHKPGRWLQLWKFQKYKEFHWWNHQRSLLDLRDPLFGSLATYLCADALLLQNQPSNLITAHQTMAAQSETRKLIEAIPKLDGTNYHQWSFRITAGLRTLDLWLVTGAVAPLYQARPAPANVAALTAEEHARIAAWDSANERSIGYMTGAMEEAIARRVYDAAVATAGAGAQVTAQHWWNEASTLYNITTPAMIYRIYVQILEWRLSANKPPQGQLDHLLMLYNQLEAEGQTLPTLTKVMTLLNALPKDWQQLVTHQVLNQPAVANITWAVATAAIGNHWDGLQAHKKHPHVQNRVNKLSAVQHKGPNQTLQQQMAPNQGSSSKQFQKKGKGKARACGARGKGKAWKPRLNFIEHQALCDTAMLTEESRPAPTSHVVSSIRPSGISTRVKTKSSISSQGTNSMWPTFNAAMRLADRIGPSRSTGTVRNLEEAMFHAPISQVVQQAIAPSALDPTPD